MYWISPSDFKLHCQVLTYLGSAGFDAVLRGIASIDSLIVRSWTIFQVSFIVVSQCSSCRFHLDFDDSLAGEAWNVMIPLVLVPDSPPELLVKSFDDDTVIHPVKYEREVALIWGPLTDHSIALFSYAYGYCVCLSVSVGSINSGNVNRFLADISQQYPPRRSSLLLEWAKSPHFSSGNCNLPSFSHEVLSGKERMMQHNIYSMLNRSCNNVTYPLSVRK
jgi:hypothetical protein